MSLHHYVDVFLKTEISCLPTTLRSHFDSYDNALCNKITWLFFLWNVFHLIFNEILEVVFRRLCYKHYTRKWLKFSLWYLFCYGFAFIGCSNALFESIRHTGSYGIAGILFWNGNNSYASFTQYLLLCTFHFHNVPWEIWYNGNMFGALSHLFLTLIMCTAYFLRSTENSFVLIALISITNIAIEMTKCTALLLKSDKCANVFIKKMFFTTTLLLSIGNYMVVIPLIFIWSNGLKKLWNYPSTLALVFNLVLLMWFVVVLWNSVLLKTVKHWIYHNEKQVDGVCYGNILECALFPSRDDDAFNIKLIKQEIKDRQAKMISLRKPKNRQILIQTLKCMVAIKRKLKEKRSAEASDSEDSEKSDSESCNNTTNDADSDEEVTESDEEKDENESKIKEICSH